MTPEIHIESFTVTCLAATAAICFVAVLVAWYTVRDRVRFSQIILGIFSYVLVMLLESVFDLLGANLGVPQTGLVYGVYLTLSVVAAREIIRYLAIRFGVQSNFKGVDAAIGFAIGFAGAYLCVCGIYYFNCYSAAREVARSGMEAFLENSGSDAESALNLLEVIAAQSGWQFICTGINRVFYLVREIALSVLMWYAMANGGKKIYYALVPLMHIAAMLPDSLFQVDILTNSYLKDGLICLLSGGIAFLAARQYNAREDQVSHFKVEHLRARRRR